MYKWLTRKYFFWFSVAWKETVNHYHYQQNTGTYRLFCSQPYSGSAAKTVLIIRSLPPAHAVRLEGNVVFTDTHLSVCLSATQVGTLVPGSFPGVWSHAIWSTPVRLVGGWSGTPEKKGVPLARKGAPLPSSLHQDGVPAQPGWM